MFGECFLSSSRSFSGSALYCNCVCPSIRLSVRLCLAHLTFQRDGVIHVMRACTSPTHPLARAVSESNYDAFRSLGRAPSTCLPRLEDTEAVYHCVGMSILCSVVVKGFFILLFVEQGSGVASLDEKGFGFGLVWCPLLGPAGVFFLLFVALTTITDFRVFLRDLQILIALSQDGPRSVAPTAPSLTPLYLYLSIYLYISIFYPSHSLHAGGLILLTG